MMKNKDSLIAITLGIGLLIFLIIPYLLLGTNAYVIIHDNLDSEFIYLHILKISGLLFSLDSDALVNHVMNGLNRSYFHSEFNIIRLLFYIFPSFSAYVINLLLVRIIGFWGMWLLAKDYLLHEKPQYSPILAILFALIPVYTIYGISILGQPLLIWAFLNLMHEKYIPMNWWIICLFPFYSHIGFSSIFIGTLLILYAVRKFLTKKEANPYFMLALIILTVLYVLGNISSLSFVMSEGILGHHTEIAKEVIGSFQLVIWRTIMVNLKGIYITSSFWAIPIYIAAFIALIFVVREKRVANSVYLIGSLFLIGGIALFYVSYPWLLVSFGEGAPILKAIEFSRFTFLIPLLWFLVLAFSIDRIKIAPWIIYLLLLVQGLSIVNANTELVENGLRTIGNKREAPSFNAFFSQRLTQSIKAYIALPLDTYRVVSIGMPPSVAQYNGLHTLDSYQNTYPIEYKSSFREIIVSELKKDEALKEEFDSWGKRCYIFSAELYDGCFLNCHKGINENIQQLSINTSKLKDMGASYILAAVPIDNHTEIGLNFEKKFSLDDAYWDVYLYKIK